MKNIGFSMQPTTPRDINIAEPLDINFAIEAVGGSKDLYFTLLEKFQSSVDEQMAKMSEAVDDHDWPKVKEVAHQLKGSSGYVGAGRIHYICYFIQDWYCLQNHPKMLEYYPTLVEAAYEMKVYSKNIL